MPDHRLLLIVVIIGNAMHPHPPQPVPVLRGERQRQPFRRRAALVADQNLGRVAGGYGHGNNGLRAPGQRHPVVPRAALVHHQAPGGKPQSGRLGSRRRRGGHIIIGQGNGVTGGGGQRQIGNARRPHAADGYGYGFVGFVLAVVARGDGEDAAAAGRAGGDVKRRGRLGKADDAGASAGVGRQLQVSGRRIAVSDVAGCPHGAGIQRGRDGNGCGAVAFIQGRRQAGQRNRAGQSVPPQGQNGQPGQRGQLGGNTAGQPVAVQPQLLQVRQRPQLLGNAAGEAIPMQPQTLQRPQIAQLRRYGTLQIVAGQQQPLQRSRRKAAQFPGDGSRQTIVL